MANAVVKTPRVKVFFFFIFIYPRKNQVWNLALINKGKILELLFSFRAWRIEGLKIKKEGSNAFYLS